MNKQKKLYVDMDGTVAVWEDGAFEHHMEPGFFKNLPPDEKLISILEKMAEEGLEVHICSAVYNDIAADEKNEWVDKYMPFVSAINRHYTPVGSDKSMIVSDISPDDFLLDDYTANCMAWANAGGSAIKWLNGYNGINGTWTGLKTGIPNVLYMLVLKNDEKEKRKK